MNPIPARSRLGCLALALLLVVAGCGQSGTELEWNVPVDPAKLVPVSGTVKVRGTPLAGAVVMLLNSSGYPVVGETGSDGRFVLETGGLKGALPGKYPVAISYMVSPKGNPQGLGARGAQFRSQEMMDAVELVPPEYSDLRQTKLSAEIVKGRPTLDFDIPVALKPPPKPKTEATKDAGESQPPGQDADKSQPAEKDASAANSTKSPSPPTDSAAKSASGPGAEKKND